MLFVFRAFFASCLAGRKPVDWDLLCSTATGLDSTPILRRFSVLGTALKAESAIPEHRGSAEHLDNCGRSEPGAFKTIDSPVGHLVRLARFNAGREWIARNRTDLPGLPSFHSPVCSALPELDSESVAAP
jgi:hypothetical protein